MIVPIIASTVILLNSAHVLIAWFQKPPGTVFTGIAHYYADYFLYVSLMAQKGWITTAHLFTNEPIPPAWIYWLYTILGKFGNPFVVYNLAIVIFSGVLMWLWWRIIRETVSDRTNRMIAFLMLTTASGFVGFDFWFSPLPALNRLGGVPHQIFQTILLLTVILLTHRKSYLPLGIVSFFAAVTNPIQMLLVTIAIGGTLFTEKRVSLMGNILTLIVIGLPALAGALITNGAFSRDPILTAAKIWENNQHITMSLWQFLLATGPIAVLVPFGIRPFLSHRTRIRTILAAYGILSLLAFFSPVAALTHTSPVRWLSPAAYTVFPILAALGATRHRTVLVVAYLLLTIPSLVSQVNARGNAPHALNYVPEEIVAKLTALREKDGVVLTDPRTPYDVLVPVFTGRKSFTGHPIHTLYPETKEELRKKFFSSMTETEKAAFLKNHNITDIFP